MTILSAIFLVPPDGAPDTLDGIPLLASTVFNRLLRKGRLHHLHLLVAVAELGSVHRAAEQLGMGQPAATRAVADLEAALGVELFERHARGMRPTHACRDILPLLRSILATASECATALAASAAGASGMLRLGAISPATTGILAPALPAFLFSQPQLRLDVVEDKRPALQAGFADGLYDAILVRRPPEIAGGTVFLPLLSDRIVVVASPRHSLWQQRGETREAALLAAEWAVPPLDSETHVAFEAYFDRLGAFPQKVRTITRSFALLLPMLQASAVVAMLPQQLVQTWIADGSLAIVSVPAEHALPPLGIQYAEQPRKQGLASLVEFLRRRYEAAKPVPGDVR